MAEGWRRPSSFSRSDGRSVIVARVSPNALRSIASASSFCASVMLATLPGHAADDEAAGTDDATAEKSDAAESASDDAGAEEESKQSEADKPEQQGDEKGAG